jgi:GT2 family glycosyltransferase
MVRSLRHRAGALLYDWPRFLRHIGGDWTRLRNRDERLTIDSRGARCEWEYTSELHIANVYPSTSRWLMRGALRDWPIVMRDDAPSISNEPEVSFLIGHRGTARLPNLLATLRSIAGQSGTSIECIVVEQSVRPEIADALPSWVRYIHTPFDLEYCRAKTFNDAVRVARGKVLIGHDNDMLVPSRYAAEVLARVREGNAFVDLKRFIFYLSEQDTRAIFDGAPLRTNVNATIVQNLKGGSIAANIEAYRAIGGFDEGFIGWGGEDLEFWERARTFGRVYEFGYLPIVHLWHRAQPQQRYFELRELAAEERIARLRAANFSNEK